MNRSELLIALRDAGYKGAAELDKIESWITENNIKFVDANDKPIDVKGAFGTAATLKVKSKPAPAAQGDEQDDDDGGEGDDTPAPARQKSAEVHLKNARKVHAGALEGEGKTFNINQSGRALAQKAYQAKINAKQAVFSDKETAEAFGAFCRAVYKRCTGKNYEGEDADEDILREYGLVKKSSSEFVNTQAGVLVNPVFMNEVLYNTEPYGLAPYLANVRNFSKTDNWTIKRKTAIPSMSYVGEAGSIASGDPTFDLVSLIPKKAGSLFYASNELLDDAAVSVADQWAISIKEARDIRLDNDYFLGDGTATYGGQVGLIQGLVSGAYLNGAGNSWSALTDANITRMPSYVQNVVWGRCGYVCSRQFYTQVMVPIQRALTGVQMGEGVTGAGTKPIGGVQATPNATFMGYPVWFSQVMPTTSASGSTVLYFGDFVGGSMIGLHTDLRIDVSKEVAFTTDQTVMRAITRLAVNICGDGRGTTYGNIVALKTT